MARVVTKFDFQGAVPVEGTIGHLVSRASQDNIAPAKFNEYERVMDELADAMGDYAFDFSDSALDPSLWTPDTIGDAIRVAWDYFNEQILDANRPRNIYPRQVAVRGRISASGIPDYVYKSQVRGVQLYASVSEPLVLSLAAGYNANGEPVDYTLYRTTELSSMNWLSLATNTTHYLYVGYDSLSEETTLGASTTAPLVEYVLPASGTSGQHCFRTSTMTMYQWSGSAWVETIALYVAKVVVGASDITEITPYLYHQHALRADSDGSLILRPLQNNGISGRISLYGTPVLASSDSLHPLLFGSDVGLYRSSTGTLFLSGGLISTGGVNVWGSLGVGGALSVSGVITSNLVGSAPFVVNSSSLVSNLNADLLDSRHAGTASGQVAISTGVLCIALNADLHDGYHVGHATAQIPLSDLSLNTDLNADLLDSRHAGTASGQVAISTGVLCSALNADLIDGYHVGHSANQIPLSDSTVNTNLNADLLDGQHLSYLLNTSSSDQTKSGGLTLGSLTLNGELNTNSQVISTIVGVAPFSVQSSTVVTNLNADLLDGYNTGHSSGRIPISDGTVNTNLNADLVDGYHATTSNTVSTVAVRDSEGLLQSRRMSSSISTVIPLWASSIPYTSGDVVCQGQTLYRCKTSHTSSSSFASDWLTVSGDPNYWVPMSPPPGTIMAFPVDNVPEGWLECDGSALSVSAYPNLFRVIGYNYGFSPSGAVSFVPTFTLSGNVQGGYVASGTVTNPVRTWWRGFDNNIDTAVAYSAGTTSGSLQIMAPSAHTVKWIRFNTSAFYQPYMPGSWSLKGSDNGSTWTHLHPVVNNYRTDVASKVSRATVLTPFTYHKLEVYDTSDSSTLVIGGFELYDTDPTDFNIPDLRGLVLRGFNRDRDDDFCDPESSYRIDRGDGTTATNVGTLQRDASQGHKHNMFTTTVGAGTTGLPNSTYPSCRVGGAGSTALSNREYIIERDTSITIPTLGQPSDPVSDGDNGTPRTGSETRMSNIYMMYCIKYE